MKTTSFEMAFIIRDFMNICTVSFFGHRQIDDVFKIEKQLEALIRELLLTKEYSIFEM